MSYENMCFIFWWLYVIGTEIKTVNIYFRVESYEETLFFVILESCLYFSASQIYKNRFKKGYVSDNFVNTDFIYMTHECVVDTCYCG